MKLAVAGGFEQLCASPEEAPPEIGQYRPCLHCPFSTLTSH